jgi:hypothetical protein
MATALARLHPNKYPHPVIRYLLRIELFCLPVRHRCFARRANGLGGFLQKIELDPLGTPKRACFSGTELARKLCQKSMHLYLIA